MLTSVNLKGTKIRKCAFCKYWYDPTNAYIQPYIPKSGFWKYETTAKCMCLKKNVKMGAGFYCEKYECKI